MIENIYDGKINYHQVYEDLFYCKNFCFRIIFFRFELWTVTIVISCCDITIHQQIIIMANKYCIHA